MLGALVCKQVGVARLPPKHCHRQGQRRVGAHVQRLTGEPDRVDADHRSHSRSHSGHSPTADTGPLTRTGRRLATAQLDLNSL